MQTATFSYWDSGGTRHDASVDVLALRGYDSPDQIQLWPPISETYLDGSLKTKFVGFRRVITVDALTIDDVTTDKFLGSWLQANNREIVYNNSVLVGVATSVVPQSAKGYSNVWINGFRYAKRWKLPLLENVIRTTWPVTQPPSTTDLMYIAKDITIVGTQASPETFTTNVGKLADNYGSTLFPAIDLSTYMVTIIVLTKQDCVVNRVGSVSQSGSNITFQLAISNGGVPLFDGSNNPYVVGDIVIGLQQMV